MTLKLVRFATQNHPDDIRVGALTGDRVLDIQSLCAAGDAPLPPDRAADTIAWLASEDALDWAAQLVADADDASAETAHDRCEVRLHAPVGPAGKVLCLATNYESHLKEGGGKRTIQTPRVFMKPTGNTLCGDGDPILITPQSRFPDYEGELAVIIGRTCRAIEPADALDCVGGYTCCNDISERRLRVWERSEDQDWDSFFDWLNGKWFDNSLPLGPCLVPARFIADPHDLQLQTRVNGQLRQETSTGLMIFSIPQIIAFISQIMTLQPGDIIATGTPAGVGAVTDTPLQPGDTVEVEISEIGTLSNPVIAQ